jgi:uncharacterized protein YutE (UPF0331/DUF86 family)
LLEKSYERAAAVLVGAALEESLRSRATVEGLDVTGRATLSPLIDKLAKSGTLTPFESDRLRGVAKLRNDAAHGGEFTYNHQTVHDALTDVRNVLARIMDRAR